MLNLKHRFGTVSVLTSDYQELQVHSNRYDRMIW